MRIKAIDKRTSRTVFIVQILSVAQSGFVCAYIEQDGTQIQFANPGYFNIYDSAYQSLKTRKE